MNDFIGIEKGFYAIKLNMALDNLERFNGDAEDLLTKLNNEYSTLLNNAQIFAYDSNQDEWFESFRYIDEFIEMLISI